MHIIYNNNVFYLQESNKFLLIVVRIFFILLAFFCTRILYKSKIKIKYILRIISKIGL